MRAARFKFLFFLAVLFTFVHGVIFNLPSVKAESSKQTLDRSKSRVSFSLSGGLLEVAGEFQSYSGEIQLDESGRNISEISLRLNLAQVELEPVDKLGGLGINPEVLFQSIPDPVLSFKSSAIKSLGQNQFLVRGKLKRGQKEWESEFKIRLTSLDGRGAEFKLKRTETLKGVARELPPQLALIAQEGSLDCRLSFAASKVLSNASKARARASL